MPTITQLHQDYSLPAQPYTVVRADSAGLSTPFQQEFDVKVSAIDAMLNASLGTVDAPLLQIDDTRRGAGNLTASGVSHVYDGTTQESTGVLNAMDVGPSHVSRYSSDGIKDVTYSRALTAFTSLGQLNQTLTTRLDDAFEFVSEAQTFNELAFTDNDKTALIDNWPPRQLVTPDFFGDTVDYVGTEDSPPAWKNGAGVDGAVLVLADPEPQFQQPGQEIIRPFFDNVNTLSFLYKPTSGPGDVGDHDGYTDFVCTFDDTSGVYGAYTLNIACQSGDETFLGLLDDRMIRIVPKLRDGQSPFILAGLIINVYAANGQTTNPRTIGNYYRQRLYNVHVGQLGDINAFELGLFSIAGTNVFWRPVQ